MTQPTPAPPAPQPVNPATDYTDIENIHWQLMAEQPSTAAMLAGQWEDFSKALSEAALAMRGVASDLAGWESPAAHDAFEEKNDQAVAVLEDGAETASVVSSALLDLSLVMTDGQRRMGELYEEYQAAMAAFESADRLGQDMMLDRQEYETQQAFLADGNTRGRFRAYWNQRAMDLANEIRQTYVEANLKLFYANFSRRAPLDYVFHPGGVGMPFQLPGGPGAGPPPGAPAAVAPPPPGDTAPPPTPAIGPPGPAVTGLTTAPIAVSAAVAAPPPPAAVVPPNTAGPVGQPPPAPGPAGGAGAAPPVAPPVAPAVVPGLFAPGGASAPAGAPRPAVVGPPGAFSVGRTATPGVIGPPAGSAGSSAPPPGTVAPPGGMRPPGAPGSAPPPSPPGSPQQRRGRGSPPPGAGTEPGVPAPGQGTGAAQPPGTGATMPPGAGMPPGAPPPGTRQQRPGGAPPGAAAPGHRQHRPGAPPAGSGPPEAFLPPAGMSPPVLGDPQRRSPQRRPGGQGEAPRRLRPPPAASLGGSVPPVLANRHHTGPRPTDTQRREDSRLARQERIRRYRELLRSGIAKDVPGGTAAVLDGRPAARDAGPTRTPELSDLLQGRRAAPPAPDPRPAADQATRRGVTDPPAAEERPAVVDDRAAWEVQTPGGPVVAGAPVRRPPKGGRPRRPSGGRD